MSALDRDQLSGSLVAGIFGIAWAQWAAADLPPGPGGIVRLLRPRDLGNGNRNDLGTLTLHSQGGAYDEDAWRVLWVRKGGAGDD